MGQKILYKCNECDHEFEANVGGGRRFNQYRCEECDNIKTVRIEQETLEIKIGRDKSTSKRTPSGAAKEIDVCEKCGGKYREWIPPRCPKCKSKKRDLTKKEILMHYD